jgi:hypothetical protein
MNNWWHWLKYRWVEPDISEQTRFAQETYKQGSGIQRRDLLMK